MGKTFALKISIAIACTFIAQIAFAQNVGCTLNGYHVDSHMEWERNCPLSLGTAEFRLDNAAPPDKNYLTVTNNLGYDVQINFVQGSSLLDPMGWAEICVNTGGIPGQLTVGQDELLCQTKPRWNPSPLFVSPTSNYGLLVRPGEVLHIFSTAEINGQGFDNRFALTLNVVQNVSGIRTIRQPKMDFTEALDGSTKVTPYTPWRNTSGHDWYIWGVSQYVNAQSDIVDDACVSILDTDQRIRWMDCASNVAGPRNFPSYQIVHSGEYVYGWAHKTGSPGWNWDFAQYIYGSLLLDGPSGAQ